MSGSRLIRTISLLSVLLFAANLLLFSVQAYIPTATVRQNPEYTEDYCSTHESGTGISALVKLFDGSDKKEGNEKHCFCYSCCLKRQLFTTVVREAVLIRTVYVVYEGRHKKTIYPNDYAKNLSSRSPPFSLV